MTDRWSRHGIDAYTSVIADLLPTGPAWSRDPDADLMRWAGGCAAVWADVDDRAADLLTRESDPRLTFEMLVDWERAFGLPDPCVGLVPQTLPDRRAGLVAKITSTGGQSRAFFIGAAASIGYPISIYEFLPVVCGLSRCGETRPDGHLSLTYARCGRSRCGVDPLCDISLTGGHDWVWRIGPPELRYFWKVKLLDNRVTWFRCGTGRSGQDHLAEISQAVDLECLIRRWKPAHTTVIFDYTGIQRTSDGGLIYDLSIAGNPIISLL